jgi:succinoglycan biosynthesis transport protein ExoP
LKNSEASLSSEIEAARLSLSGVHQKMIELGKRTTRNDGSTDVSDIRLRELSLQIPPLEREVQTNEQILSNILNETSLEKKLAMDEFAANTAVQDAKVSIDKAKSDLEINGEGLGGNHPDLINMNRSLSEAQTKLTNAVSAVAFQLKDKLEIARAQLEKAQADMASLSNEMGGRSEYAAEWANLETKKEQYQNRIKANQNNLDKIRLSVEAGLSKIESLDNALPNYGPVTPDKRLALVASLAIFSLCLVGLPVVLGLMDTRLKSINEIEKFLGVDVLATVPAKKESEIEDLGLAVMMANDDAIVESFRVLYSSLRMVSSQDSPQTMLVTSSAPSEGKSFISTNLAAFFAEQGKRTLIIDCDFRKPTQHRNVKESNDQGVIRWFHSDEPVPQDPDQFGESKALGFLALGESENLFLLRAGGTSKSPTAMIESNRFAQLIHSLRAYFDVILFDTPPVGLFPDALFVGDYTDEAIFVTKFRELNRHKVKFALSQLQKSGCNVLGIVVNHLTSRATSGYGYGYSDYGYGNYSSKDYARYYATDDSK